MSRAHSPDTVAAKPWRAMLTTETRLVLRDPAGVLLPLGLPIVVLFMNSLGTMVAPSPEFGDMDPLSAYVAPLSLISILALVGMVNLPSHLASYREKQVLRRLAVTPARPSMVLVSQVVVNGLLALIGIALALASGFTLLGVLPPERAAAATIVTLLAGAALYSVGLLVAAAAPSATAALAIGLFLFLGLAAVGGGFVPLDALPSGIVRLGELTPFGVGLASLSDAWVGAPIEASNVGILLGTTAGCTFSASALFKWD